MTPRRVSLALVIAGYLLLVTAAAMFSIPIALALVGFGLILLGLLAIEVNPA